MDSFLGIIYNMYGQGFNALGSIPLLVAPTTLSTGSTCS